MKKYVGLLSLCLLFSVCNGKEKQKMFFTTRSSQKHLLLVRKKQVKSIPQKLEVPFHVETRNSRWYHPDLIKSFTIVNKNKIVVKANQSFSQQFIKEDFFAEYDKSIDLTKLDESIVTIPFILTVIPVVWISNKTYSIKVMDKDLYHSLQEVKKVFRIFYPEQKWAGDIIPEQLVTNTITPSTISDEPALAILFSGGLITILRLPQDVGI